MIVEVGNIVKTVLEPLSLDSEESGAFIDRLAGVVKVLTMADVDENNKKVIKKFPVSCDLSVEDCKSDGKYNHLIPDSSLGCIVFLEDQALRFIKKEGFKQSWKASYKLIGWVNNAKLGKEDCSVTGQIIATIINQFPVGLINSGIYQSVNIQVIGQEPKNGQNPFSKYTFDEEKTQYLMYPYDYFSLILEVAFDINKKCLVPFQKSDPLACS